jgi:NitT/TauT family transport system permease protein
LAVLVYIGAELARQAPEVVQGPRISLSPSALPFYAVLSTLRMSAAYALSLLFTLVYGSAAAASRRAEQWLLPILDVLQSVPILSFLPVVLVAFAAILPERVAAEIASVVLIFTSQVWNMTFSWYQSLKTVPRELREAGAIFGLNPWLRFRQLELPSGAIGLIWNSVMSWSGGWFFLMAAEMFTVGSRDFRLAGLGSYLQTAANEGNVTALCWGLVALVAVIVLLDQLVWRPLLAYAERFKLEMITSEMPARSWAYETLHHSRIVRWFSNAVLRSLGERVDAWMYRRYSRRPVTAARDQNPLLRTVLGMALVIALIWGAYRTSDMIIRVTAEQWVEIGIGLFATFARVGVALVIATAWTVPVGAIIGTNRKLASWLQPIAQTAAAIPATALFPVLLLVLLGLPGGLNIAAILLMLLGTQWYLLFNVIAGASAMPQDLKFTASLLGLPRSLRWKTLILPSIFPSFVTGAITASGGAWNASIVAEYVEFGGRTLFTTGIGATIAKATAAGDYPLLLAATLSMVLSVVLINRLFWRRLYRLAERQFRLE